MKRTIAMILVVCLLMGMMVSMSGCKKEEVEYTVSKKDFYYSEDNGST